MEIRNRDAQYHRGRSYSCPVARLCVENFSDKSIFKDSGIGKNAGLHFLEKVQSLVWSDGSQGSWNHFPNRCSGEKASWHMAKHSQGFAYTSNVGFTFRVRYSKYEDSDSSILISSVARLFMCQQERQFPVKNQMQHQVNLLWCLFFEIW